ncbi:MAG TPA: Gfo/Idh/MocA family oxidoreductase [Fibrobacteria bacterium]|nr:Gfo/Idh/MocA family oxidoreductase [Fibrobacteria bacterium]
MLKRTAQAAAAFTILPSWARGQAPSDQITRAVIGCGSMGMGHVNGLAGDNSRLVAVCDVDSDHLAQALSGRSGVAGYRDFRELLAKADANVIHIPTPPHWHGLISIAAAEAGRDIWCEKPMTRTIGEGIRVMEAVRRNGVMFRLNTWFRFTGASSIYGNDFYGAGVPARDLRKAVIADLLGGPLTVTIGAGTGFDWKLSLWKGQQNLAPQPVPPNLDYDLWLGPAPYKPYNAAHVHQNFRGYWDYDAGGLGDMGQHYLDAFQYILGKDETSPVEIVPDTDPQPPYAVIPWRKVTMTYADGTKIILDGVGKDTALMQGSKGQIRANFQSDIPDLKAKVDALPNPPVQLDDFATAVRTRRRFGLNERNGFRSCTLVNLAAGAVRLGRALRFDPDKLAFVGDEEANRLIHQPMRAPWALSEGGF